MRRTVTTVVLLAAAVAGMAAAPAGPEIVDPCGDTESYVYDTSVDHPVPAGTDLASVDVVDRSAGGFDVVFEVCGERLPVATNDALSLTWNLPAAEDCTATTGSIRVVNDVSQAGLDGTLTLTCIVQEPCGFPYPAGACTTSTSTELGRVEVPVNAEGTTVAVVVEPGMLEATLPGWLAPGTRMSHLRATGATVLGWGFGPGASQGTVGVRIATHDEATGRDHIMGEDG